MKVVNIKNVSKQHLGEPLFTGKVIRQSPVTDDEGSDLSIDYVHFPNGVRNKFHKHANDQVLIIIRGRGIVATKKKKFKVKVYNVNEMLDMFKKEHPKEYAELHKKFKQEIEEEKYLDSYIG